MRNRSKSLKETPDEKIFVPKGLFTIIREFSLHKSQFKGNSKVSCYAIVESTKLFAPFKKMGRGEKEKKQGYVYSL